MGFSIWKIILKSFFLNVSSLETVTIHWDASPCWIIQTCPDASHRFSSSITGPDSVWDHLTGPQPLPSNCHKKMTNELLAAAGIKRRLKLLKTAGPLSFCTRENYWRLFGFVWHWLPCPCSASAPAYSVQLTLNSRTGMLTVYENQSTSVLSVWGLRGASAWFTSGEKRKYMKPYHLK